MSSEVSSPAGTLILRWTATWIVTMKGKIKCVRSNRGYFHNLSLQFTHIVAIVFIYLCNMFTTVACRDSINSYTCRKLPNRCPVNPMKCGESPDWGSTLDEGPNTLLYILCIHLYILMFQTTFAPPCTVHGPKLSYSSNVVKKIVLVRCALFLWVKYSHACYIDLVSATA